MRGALGQDQGGVRAPKGRRELQRRAGRKRLVRREQAHRAIRIGVALTCRSRANSPRQSLERGHRFEHARGPQRMPDLSLERVDHGGTAIEDAGDAAGLCGIVEGRCRAVGADQIDLSR